ncbi:hypothetical protein GGR51DRAFT_534715 [Nemania sp. FL0031]|nr:hypothetical protein GGR51DRAFT_534715 [Nemania sp. FL0031]
MADPSAPAQTHEAISPPVQNNNLAEEEIYDLDDPYLMHKIIRQKRIASGPITCRFLAIPLNEPGSFSGALAQYGSIICESKDKLIMRVPADKIDLLDRIQQLWVSKYLAPLTECRITFDVPRKTPEKSTTVIIQRVLGRADKEEESEGAVDDPAVTVTVTDKRETTAGEVSGRDGGEEEPWRTQRVGS